LIDELYDPIYALFSRNRRGTPPWYYYDFCVPGKGPSGKQLTAVFDPLPEPAQYFSSNFEMLLDTSKDIHVDHAHVIIDGVKRGRFPYEFLFRHQPKDFAWQDYRRAPSTERTAFLKKLGDAIKSDNQCMREMRNRLQDALELAEKRVRWNFKTAIPQYYPKYDIMSLLLPSALVEDDIVDIALVVTQNPSGSYQGRTVLPLEWAYQNARLVCRPESEWLTPDLIRPESFMDADEDSNCGEGELSS
jgi:hypothetical protein